MGIWHASMQNRFCWRYPGQLLPWLWLRTSLMLPTVGLIFRDKFIISSNKSDTCEAWRFRYKTDFIYFSWCSFQMFYKKLTCLSRLAHVGENSWENRKRELSNWRFPIQFLVKLWRTELSWDRGDKVPSQLLGDGREYSNFEFVKNVSDRRAKR